MGDLTRRATTVVSLKPQIISYYSVNIMHYFRTMGIH